MGNHEIGCLNHCPGGGSHGGGGWVAGLILLAIVIIGAAGYKVRRGIGTGLHIFGDVLQGIMWTILGLAIIGLVAGASGRVAGYTRRSAPGGRRYSRQRNCLPGRTPASGVQLAGRKTTSRFRPGCSRSAVCAFPVTEMSVMI